MNDIKISVIVPVYNVEQYLDRCVLSIINQTYSNLEILLIDDGSTDQSSKICDDWVKKDKRVKAYHKTNGGLSDARNYGIKKSTGDYIGFVDSDDYISNNMYEVLINGCIINNIDIGCCNKAYVINDVIKPEIIMNKSELISKEESIKRMLLSDPSVCNKIFNRKLFDNISFPFGKLYEDIITTPYLLNASNGMFISDIIGYYYYQNSNSITKKEFNIKKMDFYYNLKTLELFINDKYPYLKSEFDSFYILSLSKLLEFIYPSKKIYKNEYCLIKKEMKSINYKNNNYIPLYKKIMISFYIHNMDIIVNFFKNIRR